MRDRVGQHIDDYRLVHRLGAGACGEVYLGEHVHDQSQVAVKVLQLTRENLKVFISDSLTELRTDRTTIAAQMIPRDPLTQPPLASSHTHQSQDSLSSSTFGTGRPMDTFQPSRQRISRRAAMLALTGLARVGVASGAFVLLTHLQPPRSFPPPTPTTASTTPISSPATALGTTLYTYHSKNGAWALAWSPNGQAIASASDVGTVQVWNAANGQVISTFQRPEAAAIASIGWSPNGKLIAFSGLGDNASANKQAVFSEIIKMPEDP